MPIDVWCECGLRFAVPDSISGRVVRCPRCHRQFTAPHAVYDPNPQGGETSWLEVAQLGCLTFGCLAKAVVIVFLLLIIFVAYLTITQK